MLLYSNEVQSSAVHGIDTEAADLHLNQSGVKGAYFSCSFFGFVPQINGKSILLTPEREYLRMCTITYNFPLSLSPRPLFCSSSVHACQYFTPSLFFFFPLRHQLISLPRSLTVPRFTCCLKTSISSLAVLVCPLPHGLFCVTDGSSERGDKDASKITTYPPGSVRFDCELRAVQVSCGFHHSGE